MRQNDQAVKCNYVPLPQYLTPSTPGTLIGGCNLGADEGLTDDHEQYDRKRTQITGRNKNTGSSVVL